MVREVNAIVRALGLRPWRSSRELRAYQEERLRRLVTHAYARVPYYRALLDRHGVRPEHIRSIADLAAVPISGKAGLRHLPAEQVLARGVDTDRLQRLQTTGSTGMPFVVYRGLPEKYRHQLIWLRAQRSARQRPGERVARIVAVKGNGGRAQGRAGAWLTRLGLRNHMIEVGRPTEEILAELMRLRPAIVGGYPGMLAMLGEELDRLGPDRPRPRLLAAGGETLTEARRAQIESRWGAPVHEVYACYEANLLAWQCPHGRDLHVCDDSVILEVVRDGRPVPPGEDGEVVITSLFAWAMPLIRYRLADLATRGSASCACGAPFSTLRRVQGRMLDLFRLRNGRVVHPYAILSDLKNDAHCWLRHYQLVQETPDRILFRMVPQPGYDPARLAAFARHAQAALGDGANFGVEFVDRIELGPGGKFRMAWSQVDDPAGGDSRHAVRTAD